MISFSSHEVLQNVLMKKYFLFRFIFRIPCEFQKKLSIRIGSSRGACPRLKVLNSGPPR